MRTKFETDPPYWSVYEIIRDLYKHCVSFCEWPDVIAWRFDFPCPDELRDILDGLNYYRVAYFYRREDSLFDNTNPVFVEIRKDELWKRMFSKFDFHRVSSVELSIPKRRPPRKTQTQN